MIWQDIVEARSNPDKNTRQDILTQLEAFRGQDDVFVSFTAGFDTHVAPTAIRYGYSGQRVRSSAGQNKIGINPRSRYETPLGIYCYPVDYILEYSKKNNEFSAPFTGEGFDWQYLYVIRRSTTNFINDSSDVGPTINKLHNLAVEMLGEDSGNRLMGEAITTAFKRNPHSTMWNLARLLSISVADLGSKPMGKSSPVAWNVIMRRVGIDCVVDDEGTALIHSNEPTQAVFFTPQAFRVADVIARTVSDKNKTRNSEKYIMKGIKDRILDINKINPLTLTKLIGYANIDIEDIQWAASKLGAIQKRIVNESITRWPTALTFSAESCNALRSFGPVSPKIIIDMGTAIDIKDHTFKHWPKYLDRLPTMAEWSDIFTSMTVHGQDPNVSLAFTKEPWVNEAFLLNCYKARVNKFPDLGVVKHAAQENNIPFEGQLLEEAFVREPVRALKEFPDAKWTFAQWYRAARKNSHMENGLGEIIPLEYAMPILMRDDRNNFMNRDLLTRLIKEKPEFVAHWFPTRGAMLWHQRYPELVEFVAKYLPEMAARNTDFLRFITLGKDAKPDPRVVAAIWRDVKRAGAHALRSLAWALENHWISQADFHKNLNPTIAPMVDEWQHYGWGYIEDDLWVDAMAMINQIHRIGGDAIPTLMRRHPERLAEWRGVLNNTDAREVFLEYPEAQTNQSIVESLNEMSVYQFFHEGKIKYAAMNERMRFRIISACLNLGGDQVTPTLDDPNGPFSPLPNDFSEWCNRIKTSQLVDGGSWGMEASDDFAFLMYRAYNTGVGDLQLIVSETVMGKVAQHNLNASVTAHLWGNPLPDDLATELQIDFVEKATSNWQHRNLPFANMAEIVQMCFKKMAKPTQAARNHYAAYLNPSSPEGQALAAQQNPTG